MRKELLDSIETKKPVCDQFMPLHFFDYFEKMPAYEGLAGMEELAFRMEFARSAGMVFMDWGCDVAFKVETDPSVRVSTAVDGNTAVGTYHTPVGSLREISEHRRLHFKVTSSSIRRSIF